MRKTLKIGVTTRVANAAGYNEPRDCLAQDWADFFNRILPEATWMMLPNIGSSITEYVADWGLEAIILSGGNDLNEVAIREETEAALINYAQHNALPLLGVCRGLQLLCSYYGGSLTRATEAEHPISTHKVEYQESPFALQLPEITEVNSYHNWLVKSCGSLQSFITDQDGNIEGVYSKTGRLIGLGWHPERISPSANFDKALIRQLFLEEQK